MNRFERPGTRTNRKPPAILAPCLRAFVAGVVLWTAAFGLSAVVTAQGRPVPPPAESAPEPAAEPPVEAPIDPEAWGREVMRIGQDYTLNAGDAVGEVLVISGAATIEGRVDRDVVVVFGKATLSSTATIDGSLIVIGGGASAMSGAVVRRDLVVVAGEFDAPVGFMPGGQHIVVGSSVVGARVERLVPWISRGLLWGRPIVPGLPWVWGIVGAFFLVYLVLNLIFNRSVGAVAETMAARPLTAFATGLLVLLLTGPVCLLLAVSVIGVAVVPFVICALIAAWVIGKVGVARWIGRSVVRHESPEGPLQSIGPFVLGFAVICVAYMIPVLGFITWATVGVFGLGAASLAFIAGYRRERPAALPRVRAATPPAPATVQYAAGSVQDEGAVLPMPDAATSTLSPSEPPPVPPVASDLASFPRAAFRDRLAAFVLDVILVVIAYRVLDDFARLEDGAFFLILLAYHIGFWTWQGTTVGGIICQVRVVRVDGAPLTFADALVRGLSSIFSLAVAGLGCLWILKDPDRQAWHDRIAGTYVVKVPRDWPI
jgi:uncharacterized RDD family membrane protein YckC